MNRRGPRIDPCTYKIHTITVVEYYVIDRLLIICTLSSLLASHTMNATTEAAGTQPESLPPVIIIFNIFFSLWLIVTNSILFLTIVTTKKLCIIRYMLLASLSVSDILLGLNYFVYSALIANDSYIVQTWWFCRSRLCFALCTYGCSLVHLILIGAVKVITIRNSLRYMIILTRKRVSISVASIWIMTAISFVTLTSEVNEIPPSDVSTCLEVYIGLPITITQFLFFNLFTIIILACMYGYLMAISKKHIEDIQKFDASEATRLRKHARAVRTFAVISAVMTLCWLPSTVLYYVFLFGVKITKFYLVAWKLAVLILFATSGTNFFIFTVLDRTLRKAVIQFICRRSNHAEASYLHDEENARQPPRWRLSSCGSRRKVSAIAGVEAMVTSAQPQLLQPKVTHKMEKTKRYDVLKARMTSNGSMATGTADDNIETGMTDDNL